MICVCGENDVTPCTCPSREMLAPRLLLEERHKNTSLICHISAIKPSVCVASAGLRTFEFFLFSSKRSLRFVVAHAAKSNNLGP